eukprot:606945-Alexandrium_andersonii.AAC.1
MSASLVGSEMCIRDSCPTKTAWLWAPSLHSRSVNICGPPFEPGEPVLDRCLLYTSDAADDM